MTYKPYLISNFQTGKSIGLEPWLSPEDAFPTLINARINKGVLEKRLGYTKFAQMKHDSTLQTTTIMGIHTYLRNGFPTLLIMDTKRVNRYNPIDEAMTDIAGSDIFSGKDTDFFWFVNWLGVGYMVNNVNRIYAYDETKDVGSQLNAFDVQFDATGDANQLNTCRMMFVKDHRLLLLDTVENGDWHPQRCRYSEVESVSFVSGGCVDAPTQERMVTARSVGKDIAVWFEDSLWRIKRPAIFDVDTPFTWEKISDTQGSRSPYSGVAFNDGAAAIGLTNILFYDGFQVKELDIKRVRDIIDDFDQTKIRYCFAHNLREERHIYFSYANSGSTYPDRILDYNIIEKNWSIHKLPIHCLGTFNNQKVPTWLEADDVVTGADGALVSATDVDSREILGDPYPFTLMGGRDGKVYKLNDGSYDGTDDSSGTIDVDIRSSRWNPFLKEGWQARLGKIQFLVDNDANASYLVSLFKDTGTTAYKTATLSCDGSGGKFWTTVYTDGEVGNFHRMKLSHDERGNRPRIHAIMPFFERGGYLDL